MSFGFRFVEHSPDAPLVHVRAGSRIVHVVAGIEPRVDGHPGKAPGPRGDALVLDGIRDALWIDHGADERLFPESDPISLCCWFRTSLAYGRHTLVSTRIIGEGLDGYWLGFDGTRLEWSLGLAPETVCTSRRRDLCGGAWHHVAAIWDGEEMRLYVDGELHAMNGATGRLCYDNRAALGIGATESSYSRWDRWEGALADVRIYGDALEGGAVHALVGG